MSIDLNGIRLRNRLLTSASLLGYGAPAGRLVLYGLSPIAQWVPLERFGAVTTRTLTVEPRAGHFSLREDWKLHEFPAMLRLYAGALRRVDAGWLNAFGWSNIGIDRYFEEYFPRTHHLNRIVSVGGFSAEEFVRLVETVNERAPVGSIAAVEFNVSCHNVNFPFETILEAVLAAAVPLSRHPVILKLSPDEDYVAQARLAERFGVAAVTAINAVKALRLDPATGRPFMRNRFGSLSGRAIKPIGLRVVAELRDAGIRLPIIATGGIRSFDDCREYFWAGADAVSLGSAVWLQPMPLYVLGPWFGWRIRRLIDRIEGYRPPAAIAEAWAARAASWHGTGARAGSSGAGGVTSGAGGTLPGAGDAASEVGDERSGPGDAASGAAGGAGPTEAPAGAGAPIGA